MEKLPAIVEKLLTPVELEEENPVLLEPAPSEFLEVLVFQLEQEHFGVPIEHVLEIIRYVEATPVPHTVDFLEGIISLRGEMIPVLNGRKRMGHESKAPNKKTRIVILQEESGRFGITVDATSHVIRLPRESIEPAPPVVGPGSAFIEGVCQYKGQLIILLNLSLFLEFA